MENLSLILYILGIIGLCLCIILVCTNFHKKGKFFSLITLLFIFLSISSLGFGTIIQLIEKKNDIDQNVLVNEESLPTKENSQDNSPSLEDLLFEYNLKNTQFYIDITNESSEVFNGTVHIKQSNNNNLLAESDLPVSNLAAKGTSSYTLKSLNGANLLDYEFNGSFSNAPNTSTPYSITSMGIGNGYIRFEIISLNKDINSLQSICKSFKNTYTNKYCKGFLIYFIDSSNDNLDKSYADYYCNNEGTSSILSIYESNTTININ